MAWSGKGTIYEDFLGFTSRYHSNDELIAYQHPAPVQQRLDALVQEQAQGTLSNEEQLELADYQNLNNFVQATKERRVWIAQNTRGAMTTQALDYANSVFDTLEMARYVFQCENGHTFDALAEHGDYIRQFYDVMYSPSGKVFVIQFLAQPVAEFGDVVTAYAKQLPHLEQKAQKLRWTGLSLVCDKDERSFALHYATPICPMCANTNTKSQGYAKYPHINNYPLPNVTHNGWTRLSFDEKLDLVWNAFDELGAGRPDRQQVIKALHTPNRILFGNQLRPSPVLPQTEIVPEWIAPPSPPKEKAKMPAAFANAAQAPKTEDAEMEMGAILRPLVKSVESFVATLFGLKR